MAEESGLKPIAGFGRDNAFVDIYASQIRLTMSISDFAIIFSVNDDFGPQGQIIKDLAAVRLSPTSLKVLHNHLALAVEAYERVVGAIPIGAPAAPLADLQKLMADGLRQQMSGPGKDNP